MIKTLTLKSKFTIYTTFNEYFKSHIDSEILKYRGRKRLRKKKAKAALKERWLGEQFSSTFSRRMCSEILHLEDLSIIKSLIGENEE